MKTPFMPPLNSKWRTTQDFTLPGGRYGNDDLFENYFGSMNVHQWLAKTGLRHTPDWVAKFHAYQADLGMDKGLVVPAGTVISFNRYHASNSGDVQITLQFIVSPEPKLTPRKMGGKGKGAMRFYVTLDTFNAIGPLEEFTP